MRAGARTYKAALPGTVRAFFAADADDIAAGEWRIVKYKLHHRGIALTCRCTSPTLGCGHCPPGVFGWGSADGRAVGKDKVCLELCADELGWDYACVFTFEGKKYAFPSDFDECPDAYGEIKSDDMRQRRHWPDPDGDYGPEEDGED